MLKEGVFVDATRCQLVGVVNRVTGDSLWNRGLDVANGDLSPVVLDDSLACMKPEKMGVVRQTLRKSRYLTCSVLSDRELSLFATELQRLA